MHAAVPYSSQQAGGAQSRTIPYRSRRFGIGSSLGYAAFEWLGSTWCLRGWSKQPPGITPMPAPQPLSKRPLSQETAASFVLTAPSPTAVPVFAIIDGIDVWRGLSLRLSLIHISEPTRLGM